MRPSPPADERPKRAEGEETIAPKVEVKSTGFFVRKWMSYFM